MKSDNFSLGKCFLLSDTSSYFPNHTKDVSGRMSLRGTKRKIRSHGGSKESSPSKPRRKLLEQMEERVSLQHREEFCNSLMKLQIDRTLCDFIIQIGEEEIPVHRIVLVTSSKFFEAMLSHDTLENQTGRAKIHDIELSAGKQCIEFMYTGKVQLSHKNPQSLIHAAELMQLHHLSDLYFEFLMEKQGADLCLEHMALAVMYSNQSSLAKIFSKFSCDDLVAIAESEDFLHINYELLHRCLRSVKECATYVEVRKWMVMKRWIVHDVESRKSSFPDLFQLINLEFLSDKFLRKQILPNPLVEEYSACKTQALEVLGKVDRQELWEEYQKNATYIIACQPESRILRKVQYVNDFRFTSSRITRLPAPHTAYYSDIASVDGTIYLSSGGAMFKYVDNYWKNVVHIRRNISFRQCLVHGRVIYVIASMWVFKYDTVTGTWKEVSSRLSLGNGFFVTASEQCAYAMGGEETNKQAKEFDFTTESWQPIANMQYQRTHGAAAYCNRAVYALGGVNNSGETMEVIERYLPDSDVWEMIPRSKLTCSRYNFKALAVEGEVLVVGGTDNSDDSIIRFDVKEYNCLSTVTCIKSNSLACLNYSTLDS